MEGEVLNWKDEKGRPMRPEDKEIVHGLIAYCEDEEEAMVDHKEESGMWKERARAIRQLIVDSSNSKCETCQPRLPLKMEYASEDVPWKRCGHPGSLLTQEGSSAWRKDFSNTGVAASRLFTDAQMASWQVPCGVAERAFACLWDYEHNGRHGNGILFHILSEEPVKSMIRDDRDRWLSMTIAQSVVQWLGTNCGMGFIKNAEMLAKRDRERIEDDISFLNKLVHCARDPRDGV